MLLLPLPKQLLPPPLLPNRLLIIRIVPITITVPVTVAISIPVAVPMPVTIRPFIEFDVVHQDGQVGDVAVLHVTYHCCKDLTVGHALAHHEEVGVGMLHQQVGVGDDGHRKNQVLSEKVLSVKY